MKELRDLIQKGGSGSNALERSFAWRILHSIWKSGKLRPPWEIGSVAVQKGGWVLDFQINLLIVDWMDEMMYGGGGQIGMW